MMRWAILLHRYLGIAIGWLLVIWCVSGVVMMYVAYPEVSATDRAKRLPPLDLGRCCTMDPLFGGVEVIGAHIEMLGDEPLLRITDGFGRSWALGLADGRFIEALTPNELERAAASLATHGNAAARPPRYGVLCGCQRHTD